MSSVEGFKIEHDKAASIETGGIVVKGVLSFFVACGSQYSVWRQFPQAVRYTVKDLDSGETYISINNQLSVSESGSATFEHYSKLPCDEVISEPFSVNVNDIYFEGSPDHKLVNFELQVEYIGRKSNWETFKGVSLKLKKF